MINISAAMGEQFASEVTNFVEAIEALGRSPVSGEAAKPRAVKDSESGPVNTDQALKEASHDCR